MKSQKIYENIPIIVIAIYHLFIAYFIPECPFIRNVTGLHYIYNIAGNLDLYLYYLISICSISALLIEEKWIVISIILMLFQQMVLMTSSLGEVLSISNGYYPDNYEPKGKGVFIFIDQLPALSLCVLHSFTMVKKWQYLFIKTLQA